MFLHNFLCTNAQQNVPAVQIPSIGHWKAKKQKITPSYVAEKNSEPHRLLKKFKIQESKNEEVWRTYLVRREYGF